MTSLCRPTSGYVEIFMREFTCINTSTAFISVRDKDFHVYPFLGYLSDYLLILCPLNTWKVNYSNPVVLRMHLSF